MTKLRVLDLFAGIGGFTLGLERTGGFETVGFVECDPEPVKVLRRNWPNVPQYGDIVAFDEDLTVDVITGGFPCQDISYARTGSGKGLGDALQGARSGLWKEYLRLIQKFKPRYIIAENVAAILKRGLQEVLDDLASIGYDAEWHCIDAAYLGAPHRRDRCWIIAYPSGSRPQGPILEGDALSQSARTKLSQLGNLAVRFGSEWPGSPGDIRVGDGLPYRAHRLKQLGNAVSPVIPEMIGRAILRAEAA